MPESIQWGKGREAQFVEYIGTELQEGISARDPLLKQWLLWLEQYNAPAQQGTKNFPYEGPLARDTEVLTAGGWRRIDSIAIGEMVLTRSDANGRIEWHPVTALPKVYAEKLYHFKSRAMDLLVTAGHTMLCEPQGKRGVVRRMRAADLWETSGYYLPQHGTWHGADHSKLWGLPAGDLAEFVGWYLAEGSMPCLPSGLPTAITISQSTAHIDQRRRLEGLFQRLGFTWRYHGHDYTVHKSTVPSALFAMLAAQRGAKHKRVPKECFAWSAGLIERLLTGMMLGDGCITYLENANYPKADYYTISRGLAEDVQVLALLCGLHARLLKPRLARVGGTMPDGRQVHGANEAYVASICATPRAKYDRAKYAIVDYHDIAFCVTVANHAIYVRRNGKAVWTGNSANYVLPLTATDVDQLYAKFLQTVHAPENLWTISPMNERWVKTAKPLQDMLTWLDRNILKMFNVNKRVILEMTKLGTGIYKTGWDYQRYPTLTYDNAGRVVKAEKVRGVPFVDHVRLADFVIPAYSYAIQPDAQGGAPWIGERHRMSPSRLRQWANASSPLLPPVEKEVLDLVIKFEESGATDYDEYVRQAEREVSGVRIPASDSGEWEKSSTQMTGQTGGGLRVVREIELWEIHARYPSKSNDGEEDIVVWYHQPTRKIVRCLYSPLTHGQRPYDVVRYFPGEGFYGIGVCQQKEVFQKMGSDLFNFNYDNVLLANSRMVVAKSGSNIAPGEPFYPNKVWIVDDDVNKSFGVFPMADIYQSLPLLQSNVQALGERRTSIGDLQLGNMESLPSRTPATTTLSMLQESNRRVDLTIKDMRYEGLSTVGLRIVQLMQQYASAPAGQDVGGQQLLKLAVQALGMPEGMEVAQKMLMPMDDAALGIGVSITATSGSANKEVEKQGFTALLQLASSLYPQFIQAMSLAQQTAGTPVAQVALQSAKGLQELFQRLLEQYDVKNPEQILALTDQTLTDAEQAGAQPTAGAFAGPTGANPGANGNDPLQALLGGAR